MTNWWTLPRRGASGALPVQSGFILPAFGDAGADGLEQMLLELTAPDART